jgi:hypothetical protein
MVRATVNVNGFIIGFSIWLVAFFCKVECDVQKVDRLVVHLGRDLQVELFE